MPHDSLMASIAGLPMQPSSLEQLKTSLDVWATAFCIWDVFFVGLKLSCTWNFRLYVGWVAHNTGQMSMHTQASLGSLWGSRALIHLHFSIVFVHVRVWQKLLSLYLPLIFSYFHSLLVIDVGFGKSLLFPHFSAKVCYFPIFIHWWSLMWGLAKVWYFPIFIHCWSLMWGLAKVCYFPIFQQKFAIALFSFAVGHPYFQQKFATSLFSFTVGHWCGVWQKFAISLFFIQSWSLMWVNHGLWC